MSVYTVPTRREFSVFCSGISSMRYNAYAIRDSIPYLNISAENASFSRKYPYFTLNNRTD